MTAHEAQVAAYNAQIAAQEAQFKAYNEQIVAQNAQFKAYNEQVAQIGQQVTPAIQGSNGPIDYGGGMGVSITSLFSNPIVLGVIVIGVILLLSKD